jgi:catechol 2,3-dioxygenase-like lactoylglutathione lyase family enzyme
VSSSVDFYVNILGFTHEGEDGPFTVIRVNEDFTLQLAPWGTKGNEHLAFAMARDAFDRAFALVKEKGVPYGDSFHSVGNNCGPGIETGARGPAPTLYLNDPNKHLIEIRTYD